MIHKEPKNLARTRKHKRVRERVSGTATCPRLVVFRSNKHIECQIIDDTVGHTLVSSSSTSLKLEHGGNVEAAKTVGIDVAKKALEKGVKKVVFDRGGYVYHGRVAALADGAREGGLDF